MTNALFVVPSAADHGVFESQVLEYGRFMRTLGLDFRYLLFDGLRGWLHGRKTSADHLARLRQTYETRIDSYPLPGPVTPAGLMAASAILRHAAAGTRTDRLLVQARGATGTCMALEARRTLPRAIVVYDARADVVAEARMAAARARTAAERLKWTRRARRLEVLELRACGGADHILAVSAPLADRLCALGGRGRESVTIVPCCVDPARFARTASRRAAIRRELALEDRLVFVYVGSLSAWQATDRTAALMAAIRQKVPHAHLLVLSHDASEARRTFGDLLAAGACTVLACPYSFVGDYLGAADIGLLLRELDPVNWVASPVKFAEYQLAGLPVVASPAIGDVTKALRETGFGVVIDLDGAPEAQADRVVAAIRTSNWDAKRREISDAGAKRFTRESHRHGYLAMLRTLGVDRREAARPAVLQLPALSS